ERTVGDPEVAGVRAWVDEPADVAWSHPRPEDILRAIDRFHPGSDPSDNRRQLGFDRNSWAEWLYFNGRTSDGRLRFYLTFLAGPPTSHGHRLAVVRLQLDRAGRSTNYAGGAAID